ncbi:MAG: glycerate kinase [Thermoflexus sp.]|mgnify:CR=1 FL=1|uniref:glycerate kinase type-2 family protein n=1 Tax=Thermoflexus sp. TaxID=1969742 RepID=UPI00331B6E84
MPRDLRQDAMQILHAALGAVDPSAAIRRHVRREGDMLQIGEQVLDLGRFRHVFVLALGKAAYPMAYALQVLLGRRLDRGVLVTKYGHIPAALDERWTVIEAGHPVPDENSLRGAQLLAALAEQAGEEDLLLCVLSGGGSALATWPAEGLSLSDLQAVTDLLLRAGATIHELNAVRKHLDRIKGGGLARFAYPATSIVLVLSDVVGDDLSVIASGPMAPDPSTFHDAWRVLNRYGLLERVPMSVRIRLEAGLHGRIPETPKPGEEIFQRVSHEIVASNRLAAQAALEEAARLGYHPFLLSTFVEGEAREVARVMAAVAKEIATTDRPAPRPACVVWGGETTVTVRGSGRGGRNQELALAAAIALEGWPNVLVAAIGTDGIDGPTDAAGAFADGETVHRAYLLGLDAVAHLEANDAYAFFDTLGDLIRTGPTGTNVNDIGILLVGSP